MSKLRTVLSTAAAVLSVSACGGGGGDGDTPPPNGPSSPPPTGSTERGTLIAATLTQSLSAAEYTAGLQSNSRGQFVHRIAGPLACDIRLHRMEYWTVAPAPPGSAATPIRVSGTIMMPSGTAAQCSGARPLILFAHGFNADPAYSLANIATTTTDLRDKEIMSSFFAAQGYIVVAPHRVGYDGSTLGYTPYLNADQTSKDMIDALAAARTALSGPLSSTTIHNGKLLVMGISEGGFVAMAANKALQAAGVTVTASALVAGVYAVEAWWDATFLGKPTSVGTLPYLTTSYQNAYGNIYSSLTEIYSPAYTQYITRVLPDQTLNRLPSAAFNALPPVTGNAQLDLALQPPSEPMYARAFGDPFLVTDSFRQSYVADAIAYPDGAFPQPMPGAPLATTPQHPLRQALKLNDMRSWNPQSPMLLCAGHDDYNVQYATNTAAMAEYWSAEVARGLVTVLDVDTTPAAGDPYAVMKTGFQEWYAQALARDGLTTTLTNYHGLSIYYCAQAARQYLAQF